jgi:hypothetical protein
VTEPPNRCHTGCHHGPNAIGISGEDVSSTNYDVLERICQQNLGVYRASPARLREDVSQEAQVANDYRGRLAYELLQNADDAMLGSSTEDDRIRFLVTDDELWVANTGRELTAGDVEGLCGLGASTKVDAGGVRRASIGHKGMGFKSVLEVTRRPFVYSRSYCFGLNETNARQYVDPLWRDAHARNAPRDVPVMRFPAAIDDANDKWQRLRDEGFNTAFRFPFRDELEPEQRVNIADLLIGLPVSSVLFLKHLEGVSVAVEMYDEQRTRSWSLRRWLLEAAGGRERRSGYGTSGVYLVEIEHDHDDGPREFVVAQDSDIPIGAHREGLNGPGWEGVERTEVSVGVLEPSADPRALPRPWRRFHVFLPTEEPCPYPVLVNGAFMSDLSRQHVRVTPDPRDYNAYLVRQAARVYREMLLPYLVDAGPEVALASLDRGTPTEDHDLTAADVFHGALVAELGSFPLLPSETGDDLSLPDAVLPPSELGETGPRFRGVMSPDARWQGSRFPQEEFCEGWLTRVAGDHGARTLDPIEAVGALEQNIDPERATLQEHPTQPVLIDPVLEALVRLWDRTSGDERNELEERVRQGTLFPTRQTQGGHVVRISLEGRSPFYPPQSASGDLPLERIAFLCHEICWGDLGRSQRAEVLGDEMAAWTALLGIQEFRFEEVMRASVLPALQLDPDEAGRELYRSLKDIETLAAICQLAGGQTKPNSPLRFERLGRDRALFNLSRLPVPCRGPDDTIKWVSAYRVYFGEDWLGHASVETITQGLPPDGALEIGDEAEASSEDIAWRRPDVSFLVGFEHLEGVLSEYAALSDHGAVGEHDGGGSDGDTPNEDEEVGLEEDPDAPKETDERERWIAFLTWLGVNHCLRPVHFHDVEDPPTGWLKTEGFQQPRGWAFEDLDPDVEAYTELEAAARKGAAQHRYYDEGDVYFYDVHRLEHAQTIARAAATDAEGAVGRALFEHLVTHWPKLDRFSEARIAVVKAKAPGRRNVVRAHTEELAGAGDDLWVRELRSWGFCPTSRGPRRPERTWMRSRELDRRFGRSGNKPGNYLPVLESEREIPPSLATRLRLRRDLSPSTFEVDDARTVVENLARLHEARAFELTDLRRIAPIYREVFELLSGQAPGGWAPLADAPLLARVGDDHRFLPAREILYSRTPGAIERARLIGTGVPTFIIQADATASGPLGTIFGVRPLEEVIERAPSPGEPSLDEPDLGVFRKELRAVARILLARLRVERSEERQARRDHRRLFTFAETVVPVEELEVETHISNVPIEVGEAPPYFLEADWSRGEVEAFVTWHDAPWPPLPEHAQALAMAFAELLEVNLVETFLTFIESGEDRRMRLLDLAGGLHHLDAIDGPPEEVDEPEDGTPDEELEPTAADQGDVPQSSTASPPPPRPKPGPGRVPLVSFGDLAFDGEVKRLLGEVSDEEAGVQGFGRAAGDGDGQRERSGGAPDTSRADRRAAPGVDIDALDRLGMRIAMAYELKRLRDRGHEDAAVSMLPHRDGLGTTANAVFDVSTPGAIEEVRQTCAVFAEVMDDIAQIGISPLHPGFDILTIRDGRADRLIELKSSAVDARIQAMTWNEWKSASNVELRERFWLYLVGNLRADLPQQTPYVRAVRDPFGNLMARSVENRRIQRAVQLRVREFEEADHLDLAEPAGER